MLANHALPDVHSELHYAFWGSIGNAAKRCGERAPDWKRYADDLVQQLHINVRMGYDGPPSLEDLEGLTISNAVEAYHRIVEAGRQFFLALHGQPRFQRLGLVPYSGYHRILETTALLSLYRSANGRGRASSSHRSSLDQKNS